MINRSHVVRAFKYLEINGIEPNFPSRKWDIIDPTSGQAWPPKAVLRVAYELAGEAGPNVGGGWPTNDPLQRLGFDVRLKAELEFSEEADDIAAVISSGVAETEIQRLVNARLGQGGFRKALEEIWSDKCAITGCKISEILRASHIRPWRSSSNEQRLDPYNGLLLVANADALFDKGLISFSTNGNMIIRNGLNVKSLGINPNAAIRLTSQMEYYMEYHRQNIFLG